VAEPTLKTQISGEMKAALKAGDKVRVGTLRMLMAAIQNKEVEGSAARELSDDEVRGVAQKEVKKRNDSIEAFDAAGRTELADKERAEKAILEAYAPSRLDEAAVDALVDEALEATGATTMQEIGKVMGAVMAKAKGRVDGNVVQAKVKARLNPSSRPP
jgi:uncharacterized protein YqeY